MRVLNQMQCATDALGAHFAFVEVSNNFSLCHGCSPVGVQARSAIRIVSVHNSNQNSDLLPRLTPRTQLDDFLSG